MKKAFTVDLGSYPYYLIVIVGMTKNEAVREINRKTKDPLKKEERRRLGMRPRTKARMLFFDRMGVNVLLMKDFLPNPKWIAVLSHELWHLIGGLFADLGMKFESSSEEAYAYEAEYLTANILTHLMANDDAGRKKDATNIRKRPKGSARRK